MKYTVLIVTALLAGLVQGITGLGSGIVQMLTYTLYWPLATAAAVSVCVSVPLNLSMLLIHRKDIRWKKVLFPVFPYMLIGSAAISATGLINQTLMKKLFGAFLIALAIYYLFFNRREKKQLSVLQSVVCILASSLCAAFFGIGGPLMTVYFLNKTDSMSEYLGTVSAFFLINNLYSTVYRFLNGILSAEHLPYIGAGCLAVLAGVYAACLIAKRINDNTLKKSVYIMIGLTGILNLFN